MDPNARKRLNALMVQLADGDRSAFDGVYTALWPVVSAFCARTLPQADAEDAAQSALIKVFDRASTFDRSRDALTWAVTLALWEVRTLHRRRQRSRTKGLENDELPSSVDTPEGLLSDRELLQQAQLAVGTLSEADQQALSATFNEENLPGVANATFRKRRERALHRLKEAWGTIYGH